MAINPADDTSARLVELADVADACRKAFLDVASGSHWRPASDSTAAVVQRRLNQYDPATNSDGLFSGFDLVNETVVTFLEVAAGHLGGLAALYRCSEVMFPTLPLARSVVENCAHAMWVVGDGAGTPEEILARAYLEEFTSCEFAKMAAVRMGSKQDPQYQQTKRRWNNIRDRAIAAFPGTTSIDLSEPGRTIAAQVLPGPEASVVWMYDFIHKAGSSTMDERQARGVYAFLSSGTHPSLYQARQLRVPVDHGDHYGTALSVDISFLERLVAAPVLTYYNALSYVMSFYGLDRAPHDELTAKIDSVLPGRLT